MSHQTMPKAVWTGMTRRGMPDLAVTVCPYGCPSALHLHGAGNGHRAPHCGPKRQREPTPEYTLEQAAPDMARAINELWALRDEARESWRAAIAMRSALVAFLNRYRLGWRWNEVTAAWEPGEVEDPWSSHELSMFWVWVASRHAHDNPRGNFIRDTRAGICMGKTPRQLYDALPSSPHSVPSLQYRKLREDYKRQAIPSATLR